MSWVGTEAEQALRRGDPQAVAAERERADAIQRAERERRDATQRRHLESQQQAAAEWAKQRNSLQDRLASIRSELNHARAGMSNATDLDAAKQAARDIGPLELLERQAAADLESHASRMPAVGVLR